MTAMVASPAPRRRRWRRRLLIGVVAVAILAMGAIAYDVTLTAPAHLALPRTAAAPAGTLDGRWTVAEGSTAGFRLRQTVLGISGDVVGRTEMVTGSADMTVDSVGTATVRIDLATINNKGRPIPQLAISLETERYPEATVTLTAPIPLTPAFVAGQLLEATATASLTMHGVTHPVTIMLSARRDGSTIVAAGSMPVVLADWGIHGPDGYGALGSLSDDGSAEFLLVLEHG